MEDFVVEPKKGVGSLLFGIKRDTVKKILGEPDKVVTSNQFAENSMDAYIKLGITVHYEKDNTLNMVEFSGPTPVEFDGVNLLTVKNPAKWLESEDEDAHIEPPDLISENLNIAFYEPEANSRSVGVFAPGYYGDLI